MRPTELVPHVLLHPTVHALTFNMLIVTLQPPRPSRFGPISRRVVANTVARFSPPRRRTITCSCSSCPACSTRSSRPS